MAANFSFENWKARLHSCDSFTSEEKCDEFLCLLKEAERNINYNVVIELLRTFSDADDFGIQECTRNIVEAADRAIFYPALLSELSGVIARSPEKQWAITLVGIELEYGDFALLLNYATKTSDRARAVFVAFIESNEFQSEYPEVSKHLSGI